MPEPPLRSFYTICLEHYPSTSIVSEIAHCTLYRNLRFYRRKPVTLTQGAFLQGCAGEGGEGHWQHTTNSSPTDVDKNHMLQMAQEFVCTANLIRLKLDVDGEGTFETSCTLIFRARQGPFNSILTQKIHAGAGPPPSIQNTGSFGTVVPHHQHFAPAQSHQDTGNCSSLKSPAMHYLFCKALPRIICALD